MLSRTPRRDAVELWIRSGRHGDIPWPQEEPERWPDPVEWRDVDVRLKAALMMAGGARAELPVRPNPLPASWAPPWPPPTLQEPPT